MKTETTIACLRRDIDELISERDLAIDSRNEYSKENDLLRDRVSYLESFSYPITQGMLIAGELALDGSANYSSKCRVNLIFKAMRRAAMLQAGNSPVIPDGYVIVPREATEEMNKAGWAAMNEHDAINPTYRAMLAAAPQSPGSEPATVPGKWIPVSERMPENDVSVLTFDGMYKRVHHAMYSHWQCWGPEKITHWMPLPAAPQEVIGE